MVLTHPLQFSIFCGSVSFPMPGYHLHLLSACLNLPSCGEDLKAQKTKHQITPFPKEIFTHAVSQRGGRLEGANYISHEAVRGAAGNASPAGRRPAPSGMAARALRVAARRRPGLGPAGLRAFWGGPRYPQGTGCGVASGLLPVLELGLHRAVALWRSLSPTCPEQVRKDLSRRLWNVLRKGDSTGSLGSQSPPRLAGGCSGWSFC